MLLLLVFKSRQVKVFLGEFYCKQLVCTAVKTSAVYVDCLKLGLELLGRLVVLVLKEMRNSILRRNIIRPHLPRMLWVHL